jgi:hypothetical protein
MHRMISNAGMTLRFARHAPWLLVLVGMLLISTSARAVDLARHFARHAGYSTAAVDHAAWDRLLAKYVRTDNAGLNRVDYRRFKAEAHGELRNHLDRLQKVAVSALNKSEQFAFWINLYNAKTIDIVLERYPVGSIREINISGLFAAGPWGAKVVKVEGIDLSLDDIEHKILRPLWRDPRIHYAANCASIGCPNLARAAYAGATLEGMLDSAARNFVNSARGVSTRNGAATVSRIYSWYAGDFGGSEAAVLAHLRRYASPELARTLGTITRISGYQYDWRLNDTAAE